MGKVGVSILVGVPKMKCEICHRPMKCIKGITRKYFAYLSEIYQIILHFRCRKCHYKIEIERTISTDLIQK